MTSFRYADRWLCFAYQVQFNWCAMSKLTCIFSTNFLVYHLSVLFRCYMIIHKWRGVDWLPLMQMSGIHRTKNTTFMAANEHSDAAMNEMQLCWFYFIHPILFLQQQMQNTIGITIYTAHMLLWYFDLETPWVLNKLWILFIRCIYFVRYNYSAPHVTKKRYFSKNLCVFRKYC